MLLFFHKNRCPILSLLRGLSRWFRRVEIIIEKRRGSHTCGSPPRFPYLPDVSMFPRRRKGWVILKVGKKQEKEPQCTQKGENGIDRPGSGTGVQPNIKSAFQRKEQILHHLKNTAALRQLSQGVHLGTEILGPPHRAVVWSQRALVGKREQQRRRRDYSPSLTIQPRSFMHLPSSGPSHPTVSSVIQRH